MGGWVGGCVPQRVRVRVRVRARARVHVRVCVCVGVCASALLQRVERAFFDQQASTRGPISICCFPRLHCFPDWTLACLLAQLFGLDFWLFGRGLGLKLASTFRPSRPSILAKLSNARFGRTHRGSRSFSLSCLSHLSRKGLNCNQCPHLSLSLSPSFLQPGPFT